MLNVYSGNAILDANGEAWIDLPDWFEALNGEYRVHLTAIGGPAPNLHIAEEIAENRFRIAGGPVAAKVSWQVAGTRRDAYAQAHPMRVEVEKNGAERSTYLHPLEHGVPEDRGVEYEGQAARAARREGVAAGPRHLPRHLRGHGSPSNAETVLRNLLGDVQIWRRPADGGQVVPILAVERLEPVR